jgi:hypothetical protein
MIKIIIKSIILTQIINNLKIISINNCQILKKNQLKMQSEIHDN